MGVFKLLVVAAFITLLAGCQWEGSSDVDWKGMDEPRRWCGQWCQDYVDYIESVGKLAKDITEKGVGIYMTMLQSSAIDVLAQSSAMVSAPEKSYLIDNEQCFGAVTSLGLKPSQSYYGTKTLFIYQITFLGRRYHGRTLSQNINGQTLEHDDMFI